MATTTPEGTEENPTSPQTPGSTTTPQTNPVPGTSPAPPPPTAPPPAPPPPTPPTGVPTGIPTGVPPTAPTGGIPGTKNGATGPVVEIKMEEKMSGLPLHEEFALQREVNQTQCDLIGKVRFADDNDYDGLNSLQEAAYGTEINNPDTDYDSSFDGEEVCQQFDPLKVPTIASIDWKLVARLKGWIVLQVERQGQAWYVYPNDSLRYYLRNGEVAYKIMRFLSLGITNKDLAKIPVGLEARFRDIDTDKDGLADKLEEGLKTSSINPDTDGDGVSDGDEVLEKNTDPLGSGKLTYSQTLVNKLKGRILLQVESRGEAWYINPRDGKRYYMKDGEAAYQIMRFLSLGITTENLNKLPIGTLRGKIK